MACRYVPAPLHGRARSSVCAMIGASPRLEPGNARQLIPVQRKEPVQLLDQGARGCHGSFGPSLRVGENVDVELETSCPESAAWSAGDVVLETVRAAGGRAPTPERPICRTSAREAHPLRGFVGSLETDLLDLLRRVVHAARHGLGDLVICFGIKVAELLRLFDGP